MKKGITSSDQTVVRAAFEAMSKAALFDLVVDFVRREHGETVDGPDLVAHIERAFEPVALVRKDRRNLEKRR